MTKKKTTEQFIFEAKEIHGDKYDYSLVEYVNSKTKVKIICKIHGEFEQNPFNHLSNQGCCKCGGRQKKELENFIIEAKEINGDKYDYSLVNYINNKTKVKIICKIHGEFEQTPKMHIHRMDGCKKCGTIITTLKRKKPTLKFIEDALIIHNKKYCYDKVNYINALTKIIIICSIHGEFEQLPSSHLKGVGCPKCAGNIKLTTEEFIIKAKNIHGEQYDYSLVEYINIIIKINIICKKHGIFKQKPHNHLSGNGCSKCTKQYSKGQIEWLTYLSISKGYIQHMLNDSEYCIPDSQLKADGYDPNSKTIYEFHGDYWHGNPKCFPKEDMNKTCKKTFGELYDQTIKKKEYIESLGYKYVECWEYDWNLGKKAVIKLQKLWRNKH